MTKTTITPRYTKTTFGVSGQVPNAVVTHKRANHNSFEMTMRIWQFSVLVSAEGVVTGVLEGYNVPKDTELVSRTIFKVNYAETATADAEPFSTLPEWAQEMVASVRADA